MKGWREPLISWLVKMCTTAGHRLFRRIGIGAVTLEFAAGGRFDQGCDFGDIGDRAAAGQMGKPLRLEGLDHEEDGNADRDGLGKNQPKAAHNLDF
jgi:hypothetical protein